MKNKLIKLVSGIVGFLGVLFLCLAFGTGDDQGPNFSDYTRTNRWSWSTNLYMPPVLTVGGTNLTAVTTNIDFVHFIGTGGTNTFKIVDGLIMGVQ